MNGKFVEGEVFWGETKSSKEMAVCMKAVMVEVCSGWWIENRSDTEM